MEPYAQIRDASPFAASADLFTTLVAELEGPAAAGLTACELEDLLAERGREVQRQLLQDHLDLRAAREELAARERRAPATGRTGSRGTGWRPATAGCWPRCSARCGSPGVPGGGREHPVCARPMRPCRCRPAVLLMPWPGWPRSRQCAARSRPRTRRSPAAAGR